MNVHVHDRSPLLVPTGDLRNVWPDPTLTEPDDVQALIDSMPQPPLEPYQVSTAVNNPRNNGPELIAPWLADGDPPCAAARTPAGRLATSSRQR